MINMLNENHNPDFVSCRNAAWSCAMPDLRCGDDGWWVMAKKTPKQTSNKAPNKKPRKKPAGNRALQRKTPRVSSSKPAERGVPMRDFSRSLPMSLLRARESVMRHFRPSLRAHGLTEQQWRILRALASTDAVEVTELARVAYLLGPSLSRILRDLEARRLIARRVVMADLRRSMVSITAAGLRLLKAVAPSSEAIYADITRRFGTRGLAELQDMLHRLEASLLAMPVHGGDVEMETW
jgi:homoprotocatechuate degradation regulator HpaR